MGNLPSYTMAYMIKTRYLAARHLLAILHFGVTRISMGDVILACLGGMECSLADLCDRVGVYLETGEVVVPVRTWSDLSSSKIRRTIYKLNTTTNVEFLPD